MENSDIAISLVLFSAVMHATWNAVVRAGSNRFMTLAMVDASALLICLIALPLVSFPTLDVWLYILASVILNTIYRLFLIKAYEIGDFGQVYPVMRGVPPIIVAVFSYFILGEHLTKIALLGIVLISVGIVSLAFVRHMTTHMLRPILMAACAGVFIASYTVVDAKGVRTSETVLQYIIYLTVCQSIPIPLLALVKQRAYLTQTIRNQWRTGVLGGLFYIASYGLVLFALSLDAVAKVSALRECSVIIGAVIASVFFKERFGLRRLLAAICIFSGIITIKLSI